MAKPEPDPVLISKPEPDPVLISKPEPENSYPILALGNGFYTLNYYLSTVIHILSDEKKLMTACRTRVCV